MKKIGAVSGMFINLDGDPVFRRMGDFLVDVSREELKAVFETSGAEAILTVAMDGVTPSTDEDVIESMFAMGMCVGEDPKLRVYWVDFPPFQAYWVARDREVVLRRLAGAIFGMKS